MKESEITDEDILRETKEILQNPQLRQCKLCAHSNEGCTFCDAINKSIAPYMYAGLCKYYETHEERMIKKMREVLRQHEKETRKCNYLLTMSLNCLEVSMLFMEDFSDRVEREYKNAEAKGCGDPRVRKADRAWMGSYKRACKAMQNNLEGVRRQYNHFIMPLLNKVFFDKDKGEYNAHMFDDHMSDSWELAHLVLRYFDVAFEKVSNAQKVLDMMTTMEGSGVLEEQDYKHYQFKR